MHEVHAPEHPFKSVKEFFLHIVTISIGIMVALGQMRSWNTTIIANW